MPLLFVRNLQQEVVGLNAILGDLRGYEEKRFDVTTDELERSAPVLLDLFRKKIVVFSVEATPETDDDQLESVRREELFGSMPRARWVSQLNGNDVTGDGSRNRPYLTIERAFRDIVPASQPKDPLAWTLFVVWVIPPFTAGKKVLRVPARWGTNGDQVNFLGNPFPQENAVYIASWSAAIDDTSDPRWTALKGPLTPIVAAVRQNRLLYTFPNGTFTEPDDFYAGRQVRIFNSGVEVGRGCIIYHESLGETLAIHSATVPPQLTDQIYIVEPTCEFTDTLTVSGPPDTEIRIVGFKLHSLEVGRGSRVQAAGTEIVNFVSSKGLSFFDLAFGVQELNLGPTLEALGLPTGEITQWGSWMASLSGGGAITSTEETNEIWISGVVIGSLLMSNGTSQLRMSGSLRGEMNLYSTWIWFGYLQTPYLAPTNPEGIQLSECTGFQFNNLIVDVARTPGSFMTLWSSRFFDQNTFSFEFVPWDPGSDTLTGAGSVVVNCQDMSGIRVNPASSVFGQVLGQDIQAGTLFTDWGSLPLNDPADFCLIK